MYIEWPHRDQVAKPILFDTPHTPAADQHSYTLSVWHYIQDEHTARLWLPYRTLKEEEKSQQKLGINAEVSMFAAYSN